ncbi:hypothetical protein ED733_005029 [Metarhizium rileyi]|uniref:Telomeric single stranded DNA binding POT1/Cdc13 domain-containing protein n=1 Tax=Metarhizium rileyi (strain RCEF 4871) TaxID=1649241 RepID=A0A5C6GCT6_METRR|nr:hypothetical protein ED733_005029 [Metarhizium rileyi]
MADRPPLEALREAVPTSISQLDVEFADAVSLAVEGVVTITWPYSTVTNSIAFILAEHNVLKRRNHGQIRLEFIGASGKAVAHARIGGGDQLRISLNGARRTKTDAKAGLPAGSLEWQLQFTNRLLLTICRVDSEYPEVIDVNAPEDIVDRGLEPPRRPRIASPPDSVGLEDQAARSTPNARSSDTTVTLKRLASNALDPEEFVSPAFIKRARLSYGSLFEGELDLLGDDKANNKRSRRRSRFSMSTTVWRYNSRSPSPETKEPSEEPPKPENKPTEEMHETADSSHANTTPKRSIMVDEGCQTQDHDFSPFLQVQASTEVRFPDIQLAASAAPAFSAENGPGLSTPSRNLFGHSELYHEMPGIITEPIDSHATSQQENDFGLETSNTHTESVPNASGSMSAPPESMGRPLTEAVTAPRYSSVTTTDQVYAQPTLHHDSDLHFRLHDIHSESHVFGHISQQEGQAWRSEAESSYPPVPDQNQHPLTATTMDKSLSPQVETSHGAGFPASGTSAKVEQVPRVQETFSLQGKPSTLYEGEPSDFEGDEGDIEGEDYDLQNSAHSQDDDESKSEEISNAADSDMKNQVIDLEDEDDTSDEEDDKSDEEADDMAKKQHISLTDRESEELAESEEDEIVDGEEEEEHYYDEGSEGDENGYDEEEIGEEYDEEEYDEVDDDEIDEPLAPSGPREPVFIDLLSDSEDEAKADEPVNEKPQDKSYAEIPEELDQREGKTCPSEGKPIEHGIESPVTMRQPGDSEVAEQGEESESERVADEVEEHEPLQPRAAPRDAETEVNTKKPIESVKIKAYEATAEPVLQNVAPESGVPYTTIQQTDAQEATSKEHNTPKEELPRVAEEISLEENAPEETTVLQDFAAEKADVEMADLVSVVDIQAPGAKSNEPEFKRESELQTEELDVAKKEQLPTPVYTQAPEKTIKPLPRQEQQEDDDSTAAEDQIMKEYREYQSPPNKGSTERVKTSAATAMEAPDQSQSQDSDVLITVRSLRSHHFHRKTQSADSTSSARGDPSVLLAQANSQAQSDEAEPEPEPANEPASPDMLHIIRSTRSDRFDPSILLAKSPVEQPKGGETPAPTVRVTRSMTGHSEEHSSPVGTRASKRPFTPEAQTTHRDDEVLGSPSISGSFTEDESLSTIKRQLQKDLRTRLPDCVPLRALRTSLNKTVDILAVATSTPPQPHRPKHGPRDYMLELILSDPSTAPSGVSVAHVFRPHQASLPVVHRGDVVLLRRVTVVSMKGRGFGVRVGDASAWAVFEMGDEEMLPQIKGPPVEVADEEVEYAGGLRKWWGVLDQRARAKIDKATQKVMA